MKRAAAILVLLTLLWTGSASAEAAQRTDPAVPQVDTKDHPNLSTVIRVPTALHGKALRPGAVTVTENGIAQKTSIMRLPPRQLEVVMVIDTSGSMQGAALASAKVAAASFIRGLPMHARVALVSFGNTPILAGALAEDRSAAVRAVQGLHAGGETALYDAVRLAANQFSRDPDRHRSIVMLSDGRDTVSSVALKETTRAVTSSHAHLDVVELVTKDGDHATLSAVAASGGGRVVSANDPSALVGLYSGISASLLANQYTVRWRSSSHGSTKVEVRVRQDGVAVQNGATVELPKLSTPSSRPTPRTPSSAAVRPNPSKADAAHVPGWMLLVGIGCLAAALLLLGLVAFVPRPGKRRRVALGSARTTFKDVSALSGMVTRATASAEAALTRHGRRAALNERLEQAGVALRPGEYVVLSLSAVVVSFALGTLVSGPLVGLLLATLAAAVAHVTLGTMRSRRRSRFSDQLGDTLQQLAGSLRAGYGLLQAVDGLARESPEPTSSEFRRLVVEARLGRDVSNSLHAMSERIGTDDFEWVVQAIDIHREVGGDLAEVLDTVAGTIRERNQVLRQVKSLTAEGRLSAYILLALPVLLAAALRLINPTYFVLLTSGPGLFLAGASVVMLGMGALWFRKLCKLEY